MVGRGDQKRADQREQSEREQGEVGRERERNYQFETSSERGRVSLERRSERGRAVESGGGRGGE